MTSKTSLATLNKAELIEELIARDIPVPASAKNVTLANLIRVYHRQNKTTFKSMVPHQEDNQDDEQDDGQDDQENQEQEVVNEAKSDESNHEQSDQTSRRTRLLSSTIKSKTSVPSGKPRITSVTRQTLDHRRFTLSQPVTPHPERRNKNHTHEYHPDDENKRNDSYWLSLENGSSAESQGSQQRIRTTAEIHEHVDSQRHQLHTKSISDKSNRPAAPKLNLDKIYKKQDHVDSSRPQVEFIRDRRSVNYDEDYRMEQVEPGTRSRDQRKNHLSRPSYPRDSSADSRESRYARPRLEDLSRKHFYQDQEPRPRGTRSNHVGNINLSNQRIDPYQDDNDYNHHQDNYYGKEKRNFYEPAINHDTREPSNYHDDWRGESRIMDKVRKWNISFNGDGDTVMSFLERIEEVTSYYQLTQKELIKGIPMFLKDKASEWYRNNMKTWRTWKEFSDDLQRYFAPGDIHMQLEDRIRDRIQTINEPAKIYVTQLQTLMRRHGGMNHTAQLDRLWRNLRPEYKRYIRRSDVYDINDLIRLSDEFERILAEEKNWKLTIKTEPEKRKQVQNHEIAALVNKPFNKYECCWRCGQRGHIRQDCRNLVKKFCIECGKLGVWTKECNCPRAPRSPPKAEPEPEQKQIDMSSCVNAPVFQPRNSSTIPAVTQHFQQQHRPQINNNDQQQLLFVEDSRIFVNVIIGNIIYKGLIDTGAGRSFIGCSAWENIKKRNLAILEPVLQRVTVADGKPAQINGQITVEANIAGKIDNYTFMVMPKLKADVILGVDILQQINLELQFGPTIQLNILTTEETRIHEISMDKIESTIQGELKKNDNTLDRTHSVTPVNDEEDHDTMTARHLRAAKTIARTVSNCDWLGMQRSTKNCAYVNHRCQPSKPGTTGATVASKPWEVMPTCIVRPATRSAGNQHERIKVILPRQLVSNVPRKIWKTKRNFKFKRGQKVRTTLVEPGTKD